MINGNARRTWLGVALVTALVASGCGSSTSSSSSGGTSHASSAAGKTSNTKALTVGIAATTSGLNDRSFNQLSVAGISQAEGSLGIHGTVLTANSTSDYVPNLASLARQNDALVIAVSVDEAQALGTVAKEFPKTRFAIIDDSYQAVPGKPSNVEGLPFHQEQASYLAGYLTGLFIKSKYGPRSKYAEIGGMANPPVDSWLTGFKSGVLAADPQGTVVTQFSQSFVDPAPCEQLATNEIASGVKAIFQVAGGCGIGAINAGTKNRTWVIGSDADQSSLSKWVLTSALKRSNVAVVDTIKQVIAGDWHGGTDHVFSLANDGLGLGTVSPQVPSAMVAKVHQIATQIAGGKITVPGSVVG